MFGIDETIGAELFNSNDEFSVDSGSTKIFDIQELFGFHPAQILHS
ncbi:MAG: hypothetical protein VKK42_11650 [Lyngbya sp.]|nr:hypothetical protein [Lyngbya sp.]